MQEFEITSPDGRVITVTGDRMPTAKDLEQIFAKIPKIEPERNIASGVVHSALKGATVGLSPKLLAGGEALGQVGPQNIGDYKSIQDAIVGRKDYQNKINEIYRPALEEEIAKQSSFEEAHPYLAFTGDMVGSAFLPIGLAGKAKTAGQAIKTGMGAGGVLGAARGGFESRGDDIDTAINMLGGGVLGVATGGLGGGAGYGLSKGITKLAEKAMKAQLQKAVETPVDSLTRKQFKILADEVGGEDILRGLAKTAQQKGVSLAELGDPNIARALEKANMVSPTARRTIANARDAYQNDLRTKNNQVFTETLGKRVGVQDLDALKAEATKGASDLYNAAWKNKLSGQDIMELNKNSLIRDAVNDVNKNTGLTFGGRKNVDPQSVEYWDGVKRSLDDRIGKFYKDGVASDPQKVSHLMEARAELVDKLDKVAPTYKAAREIYSSEYEIDNAYNLGKKVLWNNETSTVLSKANELGNSASAKNAMKMGVRDAIEEKIGSARGDNTFKDVLNPNTQKKIKALVGEKEGQKLIDYAENNFNLKQTFNKATQGSPTAERQQLVEEAIGPMTSLAQGKPVAAASQVVGKVLQKGAKAIGRASDETNYDKIANAILDAAKKTPEMQSKNAVVNRLLNALGIKVLQITPQIQTIPVKATGAVDAEILKALGY